MACELIRSFLNNTLAYIFRTLLVALRRKLIF